MTSINRALLVGTPENRGRPINAAPKGRKHKAWARQPQEKAPQFHKAPKGRKQTLATSLTNLLYPIVFSTKERVPLIEDGLRESLYEYIGGILPVGSSSS